MQFRVLLVPSRMLNNNLSIISHIQIKDGEDFFQCAWLVKCDRAYSLCLVSEQL